MAYLSQNRGLDTIDKAQYYVWYLGWRECDAIGGRAHTEPVVKELVSRRKTEEELVKFTIEVNPSELRIIQLIEGKKGKIERKRHPSVPARDVTYAVQALSPDEDVVACIYLGFNPQTHKVVHVHVYRCDSPDTARRMVEHLNRIIALPEHRERLRGIEEDLVRKDHIVPRPMGLGEPADDADTMTYDDDVMTDYTVDRSTSPERKWTGRAPRAPPTGTTNTGGFTSLAAELHSRLGNKKTAPLLLPVKDYGTWKLIGNNVDFENRKCRNVDLVGVKGAGLISDDISKGKAGTGLVTVISLGEGGEVKVDSGRRKAPVPTPEVNRQTRTAAPEVRKESSGGEDSARGDSDIGSNRNSNKSDEAAPPSARPTFNEVGQERIRLSSGFHDDYLADDDDDDDMLVRKGDDIQAITPRWKRTQVFVPARPADTLPLPADLSPEYGSRPFLPVSPDLLGVDQIPPPEPSPRSSGPLSPRSVGPVSRNSTHSSGSGGTRRKYTPSTLGLVAGGRDEGYRSMDRGEVPTKYYDQVADMSASMPTLSLQDRRYNGAPGAGIVYAGTGDDVPVDYDETFDQRNMSSRRRLPRTYHR